MLIDPHERVPLAHLLKLLKLGECLAHDCALAQAALALEPDMRRFLLLQARQEASHAAVFQTVTSWIVPCYLGTSRVHMSLERHRALLNEAVLRGDFFGTILG